MRLLFLTLLILAGSLLPSTAQAQATSDEATPQQFIYVLKLVPHLRTVENWTEKDNQIVQKHFMRLKSMTEAGTVIMAGRTQGMSPDDFGIVIFEAESAESAQEMMEADPTVKEGIMTAQLFPYRVALMRTASQPSEAAGSH